MNILARCSFSASPYKNRTAMATLSEKIRLVQGLHGGEMAFTAPFF
jgi:hypothetical protein